MDLNTSFAARTYELARHATSPAQGTQTPEAGFAKSAASFAETLAEGENVAKAALTGAADPHSLVEALASSQLAVDTVVTVRDRVVEAYQEILRMPV
ncbi:flagellar hook-basal body complex protein FliE [Neotabrizicola shimadae]|uniref:Flagellar hook-basal body complex protein FliE n=1 Tax=Neotabrizicola shimadae TaxID=2807096 RepID=A0A8G0ZV17_9RHOB|nr:flagellar hook-basal body complex protein FliE [Neotabrizicola shimadae]QYZ69950.1 flagellar hook-basal body complex protein FliE [Neotabrizicola shimadae]